MTQETAEAIGPLGRHSVTLFCAAIVKRSRRFFSRATAWSRPVAAPTPGPQP